MCGWIAITLGDVTGIGPEVTVKAVSQLWSGGLRERFLIVGSAPHAQFWNEELKTGLAIRPYDPAADEAGVFLHDPGDALSMDLAPGSPAAARAAIQALTWGANCCLRHECAALITGPICKESIIRSGMAFIGQTEFLAELSGSERVAMMLLGPDPQGRWLRVALASTHVPIRLVAAQLTREKIETAVERASEACALLQLPQRRIGVCGLNPHAGEGGELGSEEGEIIAPAVEACRARGVDAHGPISADILFYRAYRGEFDAVVAMYHDQGLAPLKMVSFEKGVNWTLGLPFIRTSPDHGTAYDIAGQGRADASSMVSAIELARRLAGANDA